MFSFLQRKGKDLDRRGEEKSPANLKKPPLSNGPDTTSFISALASRALALCHSAFGEEEVPVPYARFRLAQRAAPGEMQLARRIH